MRINNFSEYGERANHHLQVRLTKEQKERLIAMVEASKFRTIASYVRFTLFNSTFEMKLNRILEIVKDFQEK